MQDRWPKPCLVVMNTSERYPLGYVNASKSGYAWCEAGGYLWEATGNAVTRRDAGTPTGYLTFRTSNGGYDSKPITLQPVKDERTPRPTKVRVREGFISWAKDIYQGDFEAEIVGVVDGELKFLVTGYISEGGKSSLGKQVYSVRWDGNNWCVGKDTLRVKEY